MAVKKNPPQEKSSLASTFGKWRSLATKVAPVRRTYSISFSHDISGLFLKSNVPSGELQLWPAGTTSLLSCASLHAVVPPDLCTASKTNWSIVT
mmetsp:Transcript_2835/g.4555  ORF Transcript_2835/g.4555 Transcript_2835/m.4555 type:complete len:94 (+) Transcript_2835:1635-1916(+)